MDAYRTSFDLYQELADLGVERERIGLGDSTYLLPDPQWLRGTAGPAFARWLREFGAVYAAERWDCDDFALLAKAVLSLWHRHTTDEQAGLAFGIVWEAGIAHAYSIARHADGWRAYEPQTPFAERRLPQWSAVVWIYI